MQKIFAFKNGNFIAAWLGRPCLANYNIYGCVSYDEVTRHHNPHASGASSVPAPYFHIITPPSQVTKLWESPMCYFIYEEF